MSDYDENSLEAMIDAGLEAQKHFKESIEKDAVLVHRLFAQNPDGEQLLDEWKNKLMMVPTLNPHSTQFEAGMAEGMKMFVRNIINQIDSINQNSGD